MKATLLLMFLSVASLKAQVGPFAAVNPKKDTLYLVNNDVGLLIKNIWDDKSTLYKGVRPAIVLTSQAVVVRKRELYAQMKTIIESK